jgi:FixJ family two-component response regulator
MHKMNGFELQLQLRTSHCEIPIIFITAHVNETARSQALKNGAIAYLCKPFSDEALLNAIEASLSLKVI